MVEGDVAGVGPARRDQLSCARVVNVDHHAPRPIAGMREDLFLPTEHLEVGHVACPLARGSIRHSLVGQVAVDGLGIAGDLDTAARVLRGERACRRDELVFSPRDLVVVLLLRVRKARAAIIGLSRTQMTVLSIAFETGGIIDNSLGVLEPT